MRPEACTAKNGKCVSLEWAKITIGRPGAHAECSVHMLRLSARDATKGALSEFPYPKDSKGSWVGAISD